MKNLLNGVRNRYSQIYQVFLIGLTVLVLFFILPRNQQFRYEYREGSPWLYENLIAPIDFPIRKNADQIKAETAEIEKSAQYFFNVLPSNDSILKASTYKEFDSLWLERVGLENIQEYSHAKLALEEIITAITTRGVINLPEALFNQTDKVIQVIENNVAEEHLITDFFTTSEAYLFAQNKLSQVSKTASAIVLQSIGDQLLANVVFDQNKTKSELKYHISMLSPNTGMVLRGQNIVSKGEIISSSEFVVLESLRFEIEKHGRETNMSLIIGRFILVIFPIIALSLFLFFFREDIFSMSKNLLMIFMLMIFMVGITRYIVEYNTIWVFALPLMISPIILRAFYDSRLAFMVHIVTVIIISFVVPDAFMFTYLQIITGLITIISVHKLQKRSQFFYTALFIFITYSMMYLGVELITEGDYLKVNWSMLVFFAISAGLTLLATPLIFIFERFFGLVTDVSLLEYSDTNNLLIRRLSIEAPGTFHHCIQVSNLAEAAAIEIGANQLMVRAGAMYHDIGKMENPMYFTENQGGYNPHDELTYEESAKLIIGHVLGGVEMAKEHGLPSQIIDFIRTHHGTKKVEYFYRLYKSELPDHEIKDSQFTYPGPTPFSKETSILMMADAVEAASRSIKSPDAKSFSDLVEKIIKSQIDQGQFNNANITMREINTVKKVFKKKLLNMHHLRIEYPEDSN